MDRSLEAISAKLGITNNPPASSALKELTGAEDRKLVAFEERVEATHWVYVLLLRDGYFYVGTTNSLERRMLEHLKGQASAAKMVVLHPVEALIACFQGDREAENAMTLRMMLIFGWERVRGGSWAYPSMSEPPKELESLVRRLDMPPLKQLPILKLCARCKALGHVTSNCSKLNEEDELSAKFGSLRLSREPMGAVDIALAETSSAYAKMRPGDFKKEPSCYIFAKVSTSGIITINGLYATDGKMLFGISCEKEVEKISWQGRGQVEAVLQVLKIVDLYDLTQNWKDITIAFRSQYPLTSITEGRSGEYKNSDLILQGHHLKTELEKNGAKIRFLCSENVQWNSTGSAELDKLIARFT